MSSAIAALVYNYLSQKGYRVFFDRKEIRQGRFNEQLYNHIESAKDIIILLEESSLRACFSEIADAYKTDWFCKEIMHALEVEREKHIIPILLGGYHMPEADQLPEEMKTLPLYNAISLDASEMDEVFQKYFINQGYLLSQPGEQTSAYVDHSNGVSGVADFLLYTDSDCDIYECGEKMVSLSSDNDERHPYRFGVARCGEHRFQCINNDTCEEIKITCSVERNSQKYIELRWSEKKKLWDLSTEEIESEPNPSILFEWGNGLFWGTSTHMADLDRSLLCLCRAAELGNIEAKDFLTNKYVALFDRDLPLEQLLPWLETAGEMGSSRAKVSLAQYYEGKDDEKLMMLYKEASIEGNLDALYHLGITYLNGLHHVERDTQKAVFYLERCIEQGSIDAMCRLGVAYEKGDVLDKDENKAAALYMRAVNCGSKKALTMLGNCYRFGIGVEKNQDKAVELYKKAVDSKNLDEVDPWSEYIIGLCYKDGSGFEKDTSMALDWFFKAARNGEGSCDAMYELGHAFLYGDGTEKNEKFAYEWFSKASSYGQPYALFFMGYMFSRGLYVEKDTRVAIDYFTQASKEGVSWASYEKSFLVDDPEEEYSLLLDSASKGYDVAQYEVGLILLKGSESVEKNETEAFDWIVKSAHSGNPKALFILGDLFYSNGLVVSKDEEAVFDYYRASAERGYPPAEYKLAKCYEQGTGTKVDLACAYNWYKKAAEQNYYFSYTCLVSLSKYHPELCSNEESELFWTCKGIESGDDRIISYVRGLVEGSSEGMSHDYYLQIANSLRIASNKGSLEAKRQLAELYLKQKVSSTPIDAISLYEEVAEAGNSDAQYQLALYYLQRHRPFHKYIKNYNPSQAAYWLDKASEQGNPLAQYKLGLLYKKGVGVTQDLNKAECLFQSAIKAGLKEACKQFAEIVRKNHKDDMDVFYREMDNLQLVKIALSDVKEACIELKRRYNEGSDGIPQDTDMAEYWQYVSGKGLSVKNKRAIQMSVIDFKLEEPHKWFWEK